MSQTNHFPKLKQFIFRIKDDDISGMAAQSTYFLILSIFPLLIFILSILRFTPVSETELIQSLTTIMPGGTSDLVINTVNEVISSSSATVLSVGMLATLWSASKGSNALIKGINKAYDVEENRNFLQVKGIAILTTLGIPLLVISSFLFLVLGENIGVFIFERLGFSDYFLKLWTLVRFIFPIVAMVIFFSIFFKFAPNRRLKFKDVIWGACFSSAGWILISLGFSFYVSNFGNYSRIYGSLGSIIVLLLWLYISSMIIMLGGELNATLAYFHQHMKKTKYEAIQMKIPFIDK